MTALGDFSSGDVLTAADLNAIGTWTSFTPTWTSLTVGNGTHDWAQYAQINDVVLFSVRFTLGSTSSVGTNPRIAIPVATSNDSQLSLGTGRAQVGSTFYPIWPYMVSDDIIIYVLDTSTAYAKRGSITATTPATWTTGDSLQIQGSYYV